MIKHALVALFLLLCTVFIYLNNHDLFEINGDEKQHLIASWNLLKNGVYSLDAGNSEIFDPSSAQYDVTKDSVRKSTRDRIFHKLNKYYRDNQIPVDSSDLFQVYDQITRRIVVSEGLEKKINRLSPEFLQAIGLDDLYLSKYPYKKLSPTAYREPLPSLIYCLALRLNKAVYSMNRIRFMEDVHKTSSSNFFLSSIWVLAGLFYLASLSFYVLFYKIISKSWLAILLVLSPTFVPVFRYELFEFNSTIPSYFFLSTTALCFYFIIKKPRSNLMAVLAGLSLGLLALCKAHFLYVIIFIVPLLYFQKKSRGENPIKSLLLFLFAFIMLVGSWACRNYIYFDKVFVSHRAGTTLAIRYEYGKMNRSEIQSACSYFFGVQQRSRDNPEMKKLNDNYPMGYYTIGHSARLKYVLSGCSLDEAEERLLSEIKPKFFRNSFQNILLSIPFSIRGVAFSNTAAINLVLYAATIMFALIFLHALYFKKWLFLIIGVLPFYSYLFMTYFTYNIPRFNVIMIPLILFMLIYPINGSAKKKQFY